MLRIKVIVRVRMMGKYLICHYVNEYMDMDMDVLVVCLNIQ